MVLLMQVTISHQNNIYQLSGEISKGHKKDTWEIRRNERWEGLSEQTPKNAGLVCFDILSYRKWHPLVFLFSELDYQHSSSSVLTTTGTIMKQPLKNHWSLTWSCNLQRKFQKSRWNIQNHLFDNDVFHIGNKMLNWLTEMSHYVDTNPQIFRLYCKSNIYR